ncbi:formylglycine-generating enzyme family protein [Massilia sp. TS11]|uniref:formylglycine-generating enzyme family protein n=1 Tax=Massilia sp. TS11 TaxID=2908003 RepID=UPI001EDC2073|nr:formylglycine-generating enzyme family protein [Massilia sp. TS11]MCG2583825.1 formylglycine-generating enzyme family protein [Massilia sp. TS11]
MRVRLCLLALALACCVQAQAEPARYVPIPAGSFSSVLSGGSAANLPVRVAPFALRETPVTNGEYLAFLAAHPEWTKAEIPAVFADASYLSRLPATPLSAADARRPVTSVSWFAAQAFCEAEGARLPTWYEWEYVAAADAKRRDARSDPAWRSAILSWYARANPAQLPQVGAAKNAYGVRDMHGLVWEWVDDFNALLVSADSRNQGDPSKLQYCGAGAISLQDRENFAVLMRVALLSALNGTSTTDNLGFRCARALNKEP